MTSVNCCLSLISTRVTRILGLDDGEHLLHDSHSILESSDEGPVLEDVQHHDGLREGRSDSLLKLDGQQLVKPYVILHLHGVPFSKRAVVGRFLRRKGVDLAPSIMDASHLAASCRLVLEGLVRRWFGIAMKTIQLAD
eukprot:6204315-Pleurochrysis_carterae.AAC.2